MKSFNDLNRQYEDIALGRYLDRIDGEEMEGDDEATDDKETVDEE